MKTTFKTALAVLLLAGVSTAALAQDRDYGDRGDRGSDRHANGAPAAAPAAPASAAPAPQPRPEGSRSPQDGHARFGAPPPSGVAPAQAPAAGGGQRFNGAPSGGPNGVPSGGPREGGDRHWDRGGPNGQGDQNAPGAPPARPFDHARGPNGPTPPPANGDRGWDGRRDGRDGRDFRDGRDDHRDGRDGRDRHWDGRDGRDGRWPDGRQAERWQSGRYPPVYWSHDRYRIGQYRAPYGFYVRSWGFGEFLPRGWYGPDYFLDDFIGFGLPYPPPGYEWVRVGGDAIMIDRYSGRVVQVVRGIFW